MIDPFEEQGSTTEDLLDYIALGLLLGEPNHGYALYETFVAGFDPAWQAGRSKFYATLNDLHDGGYLDAETVPQEGRPPRRVYSVTEAGRAAFQRWLDEPTTQPRDVRVIVPVKLRLYEMLGLGGADDLLDAQIAVCEERLAFEAQRAETPQAEADDLFYTLLYEFRRRQLLAMIDWLGYCKIRFAPDRMENDETPD
jgi:PadR family transcriptional regulator AphA